LTEGRKVNGHDEHDALTLLWHDMKQIKPVVTRLDRASWIVIGLLIANGGIGVANLLGSPHPGPLAMVLRAWGWAT
jgi:hypothetical protein